MIERVSKVIASDEDTALFLVDIGVWAFREVLTKYPQRAMNVGIFEDGMLGVAAGMSLAGMTPFVYGISPFILGRAYEQLKLDFCYQKVGGNFITTGAAYDFPKLGYSHYCAEDVELAKTLPGMEFLAPGSPKEFRQLFDRTWNDGRPTYFRLTDHSNAVQMDVEFGRANVVKRGSKATIIAVSTMLELVLEACRDEDVTVLYYTTLEPFDGETLRQNCSGGRVILCEPHYAGALARDVDVALHDREHVIECFGVPRAIDRSYGTKADKDRQFHFDVSELLRRIGGQAQ